MGILICSPGYNLAGGYLTDGHKYLKSLLGLGFSLIEDFTHASVESLAGSDLETQKKKMCLSAKVKFRNTQSHNLSHKKGGFDPTNAIFRL